MDTEQSDTKSKGQLNRKNKKRYRGKTQRHRNRAPSRNGRIRHIGNGAKVSCQHCYPALSTRLEHKKEINRELQPKNRYVL